MLLKEKILVINCSKSNLDNLFNIESKFYKKFFYNISFINSDIADELKEKIKNIYRRGFINTLRPGDTGVGYTLESLLNIPANNNRQPDYKGIELKSSRARTKKNGRITIFSQVPNWQISNLKSSKEILLKRGKYNLAKGRRQLFHQFVTTKTNSYDMK